MIILSIILITITVASGSVLQTNPTDNSKATIKPEKPNPTFQSLQKTVIITFDDGWSSQLNAISILNKYGYRATLGIVTSYVNNNYEAYMNWSTIQDLAQQGYDIESHTVNHKNLEGLSSTQLSYELTISQQDLLYHGIKSNILIYPFGSGYNNETVREAVSSYYLYARNIVPGYFDSSSFDAYSIPSFMMENGTSLEQFVEIVNAQRDAATILLYHKISNENVYTAVTPENFASQIKYLNDNGFTVLTLKQALGI